MVCSYTLGAKITDGVKTSTCLSFDPNSDGSQPWNDLQANGEFSSTRKSTDQFFGEMACGLATKTNILGNTTKQVEMVLVWDMPTIFFPKQQRIYNKFYTKYFGADSSALKIAAYALENYNAWEDSICHWQEKVLNNR